MKENMPHVVIIGAGFGGLRAARALAKAPVHITLVDRNNYHLFQPLLYQVATAGLSPDDIIHPVRSILRNQKNFEFRLAEVKRIDVAQRCLETDTGSVSYDYLVLAAGGETNTFGIQSVAQNGFGLKSIGDATRVRNHILSMFELAAQEPDPDRRRAMLTFVVVGGGPTGVECSGAVSELIRLVLTRDYPALNIKDVRVVLLEAAQHLLAGLPERLSEATAETLWRKHVEVRFGSAVTGFDGKQITLKGGEILPAYTLVWAAGVRAVGLGATLGAPMGSQGRVKVTPTLNLADHPEVFIIGDSAYLEDHDGKPLPMVAPVAMQQAATAANNIRSLAAGKPLRPFVYKDPGTLATIGRNAAVAHLGRWNFTGFLAWWVWLVVHLVQLIGFRNRLVVLINWAWDYIFYDRAIRLIVKD
jgi:NADH:ubiquinone reductase (H+-translocating)